MFVWLVRVPVEGTGNPMVCCVFGFKKLRMLILDNWMFHHVLIKIHSAYYRNPLFEVSGSYMCSLACCYMGVPDSSCMEASGV